MIKVVSVPQERVRLFNTIAIETGALCNRSCVFCPNHHHKREDEFMPWSMIEKIVGDLVTLKFKGRISPYIYNEPLRDERMPEILAYFRKHLPRTCLMLNSNADYVKNKEDIQLLIDCGLNQLQINVYSASDGSKDPDEVQRGIEKATARADQLQQMIDELGVNQDGSLYTHIGSDEVVVQVARKFGVQPDGSGFGGGFELQNRSGLIEFMNPLSEPLDKMCVRPFRTAQINWKGDMVLCCNDYHGKVNAGNVMDHSVEELWNSEVFNVYRLKLQNQRRDIFLCDKCDFRGGQYPHMIWGVTFGEDKDDRLLNSDLRADVTLTVKGKRL